MIWVKRHKLDMFYTEEKIKIQLYEENKTNRQINDILHSRTMAFSLIMVKGIK